MSILDEMKELCYDEKLKSLLAAYADLGINCIAGPHFVMVPFYTEDVACTEWFRIEKVGTSNGPKYRMDIRMEAWKHRFIDEEPEESRNMKDSDGDREVSASG